MAHLQGKFVWFEHLSNDSAAASRFYENLFGWHTESMPMGEHRYSMIINAGLAQGGYSSAEAGAPSSWLSYLSVNDIETSHAAALAAGARSQTSPVAVGDMGRCSIITDPTGATVALWTGNQDDQPDVEQAPDGAFCWNELWTGDAQAALAFYEGVFGYGRDSMDMGDQGTYYMLTSDGKQRAGVMQDDKGKAPPMWLPYVVVADTDASAAKAEKAGASIVVPPTDIPIGRFAVFIDPFGAALGVVTMRAGGQPT